MNITTDMKQKYAHLLYGAPAGSMVIWNETSGAWISHEKKDGFEVITTKAEAEENNYWNQEDDDSCVILDF